ncbi:MAG: hypothetical protein COU07_00985 [Candidatus Harrisonbacteria bacterium CG10_big_fil_rev_8_21_14_0_10_40_38]|uniref:Carotenoid oxygenase n=1 Tax=Candidatus Harrisonbacteria bacterium CG10_big_fil_rev_8_21_14_0_10_40_38 TaxID=1974583 RepID=A0A2H0USR4_9BACT|nr:MAG: hypothetical protein COU07_00985 [Candidatus Harrisonbacteria bacterium CG10_big_fil_rev_8_21_14_0_10_40_38]
MKKIVLFDFDGVIVDTCDLSFEISNGFRPTLSKNEYLTWFEGSIYDRPKHKNRKDENEDFFKIYNPRLMETYPISGIEDVLGSLHKKYLLVVVSSTISSSIEEYLSKFNLLQYFDKVFGSDVHKSKVEKINMVFSEYGVGSGDCIFVTDTLGDMREAEHTGVNAIGVSWGIHPVETLQRGNPVAIVHGVSGILTEIDGYFKV